MENKLYLSCQCNSEVLTLDRFEDEEEIYLTVYSHSGERYSFWERVKILFGGKVRTADVVLSIEDFEKIKQF